MSEIVERKVIINGEEVIIQEKNTSEIVEQEPETKQATSAMAVVVERGQEDGE